MIKKLLKPTIFFTIFSIYFLFPLLKDPINQIPDKGDTYHNLWIMGINAQKFLHRDSNLNDANIYYPHIKDTFVYSEKIFLQSIFYFPFFLLNQPFLGYNLDIFLSFIACGVITYLIFYEITKNDKASLVGSFIFTFFPFKFMHLAHLQFVSLTWFLLPILYLVKIDGKIDNLKKSILFSLICLPQLISWGYVTIFLYLTISVIIFFSILYSRQNKLKMIRFSILSFLIIILVCLPVYFPYLNAYRQGIFRPQGEINYYGVDLLQWLTPAYNSHLYVKQFQKFINISPSFSVSGLFSGFTFFLLLLTSIISFKIKNKKIFLKTDFDFSDKWKVIFYLLLISSFLFSLGGKLKVANFPVAPNPFYDISRYLIFGQSIRYIPFYGLLIFFSFGFIIASSSKKILNLLWFPAILFLTIEFKPNLKPAPYNFKEKFSESYQWLRNQNEINSIIEVPIIKAVSGADPYLLHQYEYMFLSTFHYKSIHNGISGFFPPNYVQSLEKIDFTQQSGIDYLKQLNINYALVHFDKLTPQDLDDSQRWLIKPIKTFSDNSAVYKIE